MHGAITTMPLMNPHPDEISPVSRGPRREWGGFAYVAEHHTLSPLTMKKAWTRAEFKFDRSWIWASAAAAIVLVPAGIGFLAWKWRERGIAFRMNLVLCPACVSDREDFYGRVSLSRDSYRLHPCYAGLEEHGFVRFVPEAEFKKWEHVEPS